MKRTALLFSIIAAALAFPADAANVTNTVLMVDQRGALNVDGVASVADVATNAVKAQIAEAKAEAAQETARGVTDAIQSAVGNIMSNNVVIYRSGFSDSFAALVVFSPDDKLVISEIRPLETSAATVRVALEYVSTADIGALKPIVMANNTLGGATQFAEVADANVTDPVYHNTPKTIGADTFDGYYSMTVTIPNPDSGAQYFFWIKVNADAPSGDGTTLDLPNGVTGGITGDMTWGDKILTFRGGVLLQVREAD